MSGAQSPLVYVGVDGSLTSLRALRQAAAEARRRRAELHVAHVRDALPARSGQAGTFALTLVPDAPREDAYPDDEKDPVITNSLQRVFGGTPNGLTVRTVVLVGRPAKALATLGWRADDLLVVGTDGGSRWRHPLRRSVSASCVRHARCPVLVVPPDEFARAVRGRTRFHRSAVPRNPWVEFDAVAGRQQQHAA